MMNKRPTTLTDFRNLGKRKLNGVTPEAAKKLHDKRQAAAMQEPVANLSWWLLNRKMFACNCKPAVHTLPLPSSGLPLVPRKHLRKKNWNWPEASIFSTSVEQNNEGKYSRSCTFTHWTYTHSIECFGAIVGRYLVYRIHTSSGIKMGKIKVFRGWQWKIDRTGVCMSKGKAEYHPTADDLLGGITSAEVARRARENESLRIAADREMRQRRREEMQIQEGMRFSRVTLHDSSLAGNCLAGTVMFCHNKLGVRVHSDNPYQTISASALLETGDQKAARAARLAYLRETMISI